MLLTQLTMISPISSPTSKLPDELLSMIFEEYMVLSLDSRAHCGELVSHVSHHWRNIALTTPRLWAHIQCIHAKTQTQGYTDVWLPRKCWQTRAAVHLSRSAPVAVTIHLKGLRASDITPDFLRLISDNAKRCRRFVVECVPQHILPLLFACLGGNCESTPLLTSIGFRPEENEHAMKLHRRLFPSNSVESHLTTAQLRAIHPSHLPFFVSAFASITSLQLTAIRIGDLNSFSAFRHFLTHLQLLRHLEVQLTHCNTRKIREALGLTPIVLPALRYLHVCAQGGRTDFIDDFLQCLRAVALDSVSVGGWVHTSTAWDSEKERDFPAIRHLIIRDVKYGQDFGDLARRFPGIERLTCQVDSSAMSAQQSDLHDVLASLLRLRTKEKRTKLASGAEDGNGIRTCGWPNLHTFATGLVRACYAHVQAPAGIGEVLSDAISILKIRTLLLTGRFVSRVGSADGEVVMKLREAVEVGDFWWDDDWPTPFEGISGFGS